MTTSHRKPTAEPGLGGGNLWWTDEISQDRIVQTFTFDGEPDAVALETLRFEDLGERRTRLHVQSLVDSFEGRDQWLASGMETGVDEGSTKLDALLAELR